MQNNILRFIRNHAKIMYILSSIYNFFCLNRISGLHKSRIMFKGTFLKKTKIINRGKNNIILIEEGSRLSDCTIRILGDNNIILINNDCDLKFLDIWCENGSEIKIGNNTHITGYTHLAATEGKRIEIGAQCLFSSEIIVRTGDSHSILNEKKERINCSKDVVIGNHVWVGQRAIILKAARVGDDCIVGAASVLTGNEYASNTVIVGQPDKVVKCDVNWNHLLL